MGFQGFQSQSFAVTLNTGEVLRIEFEIVNTNCPGGPCDVLLTGPEAHGSFSAQSDGTSLFDGNMFLGFDDRSGDPCCQSNFRSAASLFSTANSTEVDFTSIVDGSIDGVLLFSLTQGHFVWNNDFAWRIRLGRAEGPGLVQAVSDGVRITSIQTVPSVPEPGTALLLVAGLGALLYRTRRRV